MASSWSVGDFALRKGRQCKILKIHYEMDPPSVTVKMLDTGDDVGTEFSKLQPLDPSMIPAVDQSKEPWACHACTIINDNPNATECFLCLTPRVQFESSFLERPVYIPEEQPHDPPPPAQPDDDGDVEMTPVVEEQMEENEWDIIDSPDDELNVVSWNVWFREDIAVEERIAAIVESIERCHAHLVVLQEVTPKILELIQQSPFYTRGGWQTFGVDEALAVESRAYFVVILSRMPLAVDSRPRVVPFPTNMGRYCLAMDFAWKNETITIATTHLESREGEPNKYSRLRHDQITACFDHLRDCGNVIFAGDLNWVDSSSGDGELNVPREWQDVWLRLRGNEPGTTYDELSNEMLLGMTQTRQDRIFTKGDVCSPRDVKLIGCEPIRGVTYETQAKGLAVFDGTRTLPVYPSSHFGLYARFGWNGGSS